MAISNLTEYKKKAALLIAGITRQEGVYLAGFPLKKASEKQTRFLTPLVNFCLGENTAIRELAEMVKRVVGYAGEAVFGTIRPNSIPGKADGSPSPSFSGLACINAA